jgi:hypothetical protein
VATIDLPTDVLAALAANYFAVKVYCRFFAKVAQAGYSIGDEIAVVQCSMYDHDQDHQYYQLLPVFTKNVNGTTYTDYKAALFQTDINNLLCNSKNSPYARTVFASANVDVYFCVEY